MPMTNYYQLLNKDAAYLSKKAMELVLLDTEHTKETFSSRNIVVPSETVSTILCIEVYGPISLSDVARHLKIPHQLASHRTKLLMKNGLLIRTADANDGRRSFFTVSKKGKEQAAQLKVFLEEAQAVYSDLFEEISCNLLKTLDEALAALRQRPLKERMGAVKKS